MYSFTKDGVSYEVEVTDGGQMIFSPPLPDGIEGRMLRNLADMVISRTGPGLGTETAKVAGIGTLDKQFKDDPYYLKIITENSKRLGYTPKPTDIYMEQLVRPGYKRGDPEAFISAADASGQVKKVLQKRAAEKRQKEANRPKIANDIMARYKKHYQEKDRDFKKLTAKEQTQMIVDKHAPKD